MTLPLLANASLLVVLLKNSSVSLRLGTGSFWAMPRYLAFAPGRALFEGWLAYEIASANWVAQIMVVVKLFVMVHPFAHPVGGIGLSIR